MAKGSITVANAARLGQAENHDGDKARVARMKDGDVIRTRILRADPAAGQTPHFESYEVPYTKWMRVLDVLNYVAEELEEDLSYRWFCGNKMCGTCAVRVNGREVLACWESAEPDMTIEPLRNAPVIRDLAIDRTAYEQRLLRLVPWLERRAPYTGFPEQLSHREMAQASHALDCISCMACFSACPVVGLGEETRFAGPAPLVQLARVALDPRDGIDRGRLALEEGSVFDCVSCYKCEEVCPASIPIVTGAIEPLKALAYRSRANEARHARVFRRIIERRGRIDPSELVLRVQGLAALKHPVRALKLWLHGKINPFKTVFGAPVPGIAQIQEIFRATRKGRS